MVCFWVDIIIYVRGYDVLRVRKVVDTVLSIIKEPRQPDTAVYSFYIHGNDLKGLFISDVFQGGVDNQVSNLIPDCEAIYIFSGVVNRRSIICMVIFSFNYPIDDDIQNSFISGTSTLFYPFYGTNLLDGKRVNHFVCTRNKVNGNCIGIFIPVYNFSVSIISINVPNWDGLNSVNINANYIN